MQRLSKPMVQAMKNISESASAGRGFTDICGYHEAVSRLKKRGFVAPIPYGVELTPSGREALKEHLKKGT